MKMMKIAVMMMMMMGAHGTIDPQPLHLPGDVVIGVVGDIHGSKGGGCGFIRPDAVEQVVAAEWALSTINNQSQHDYTIGVRVYDACGDPDTALRQTVRLLQDTQPPYAPLLGVVAIGSHEVVAGSASPLHAFKTPLLITASDAAHSATPADNVFTTAPHLTDQLQAVLSAGVRVGGGVLGVSVVCSCERAGEVLRERAARAGLDIKNFLPLNSHSTLTSDIENFINKKVRFGGVVLVILSGNELRTFIREVTQDTVRHARLRWVFATLSEEEHTQQDTQRDLMTKFPGSLLVKVHSPSIPGFSDYFADVMLSNTTVVAPLAQQYIDTIAHCDTQALQDLTASPCLDRDELARHVGETSTTATVKAVSSLAAAFRLVQIERCSTGVHCLQALQHDLHQDILDGLLKLSFTVGSGADRIRYTADGRLINTFTINHVTPQGIRQVGVYREDTGVVWSAGEVGTLRQDKRQGRTLELVAQQNKKQDTSVKAVLLTHEDYIGRTWAFTVLVVACVGVLASLYITVYVAIRVCDGTLTGPQVLGGVLLLSVMGIYASCVVYVLPPSPLTCSLRQWLPPMCLALCYAILLVKAMHLRALVGVGVGGQVSQANLHVSLFFMVAVEAALCLLGHAGGVDDGDEPLVTLGSAGGRQCGQKLIATLVARVYLLFLLTLSLVLAAINRNIHRNHNEGRWLLLTSCVSAPIVCVWTVMSYMAPPSLEPPTTSVALLVLASLVLIIIFVPKMRVIARQAHKFRHKRLGAAPSISTVFSGMDENPNITVPTLKDAMKPPSPHLPHTHTPTPNDTFGSSGSSIASQNSYRAAFSAVYGVQQTSPLNSPRRVMRNPIYDTGSHGAYP